MSTFEEHIDAFLDGELEGEARKAFLMELERDPKKLQALNEYKRLNEVLHNNARTAAVPLLTQRALAERIPVLKDVDPRLAPLTQSGPGLVQPVSGNASRILTSGVVRTLRILSIVGVAVVGSWYGVTQFVESSGTADAEARQTPTTEQASPPVAKELLHDAHTSTADDAAVTDAAAPHTAPGQRPEAAHSATGSVAAIAPQSRAGEQLAAQDDLSERAHDAQANEALPTQPSAVVDDPTMAAAQEAMLAPPSAFPQEAERSLSTHNAMQQGMAHEAVVFPVQQWDTPLRQPVHAELTIAVHPPLIPELEPESNASRFVGYLESGASGSEFMLTGFGNASGNMYGTYVVGLQYKIGERILLGAEYGRSPYSRRTITLVPIENNALDGITLFRREAGTASGLKSWLQLHGEYVFNPDGAITFQAIGGFGSVFDTRFIPAMTLGAAAGYELFPAMTLRAGLYFNGAWMPADLTVPQFIGSPGQPIGVITSGETIGTTFSSSIDVRLGLGFRLW